MLPTEYRCLRFSCVFPVAYSPVQFPVSSCKFQLQILFTLGEEFAGAKKANKVPVVLHEAVAEVSGIGNYRRDWLL